MTRPVTIGSLAGVVVGGALGALAGPLGIAIGALLGLVAGAAAAYAAVRRTAAPGGRPATKRVDPFTVADPWRRPVQRALAARTRFDEAVAGTRPGPVRERMGSIGLELGRSVDEIWTTAQAGDELGRAHRRLDAPRIRRDRAAMEPVAADDPRAAALDAQLATVDRIAATIDDTRSRLELLVARLDEVVARAIELSVDGAQSDALAEVESGVGAISDELEALRLALAETSAVERRGTA